MGGDVGAASIARVGGNGDGSSAWAAANRNPRRCTVARNRGCLASSPSACRISWMRDLVPRYRAIPCRNASQRNPGIFLRLPALPSLLSCHSAAHCATDEHLGLGRAEELTMRTRGCLIAATALLFSVLLANTSPVAMAQGTPPSARPIEPGAGSWRTWVISSGKDLRLPSPPDDQATKPEFEELKALITRADALSLDRVQYWDAGSPSYRWNEIFTDIAVTHGAGTVPLRAAVLMNVAIHDALIAAWDSKYAHNRKRPHEADPRVTPVITVPR